MKVAQSTKQVPEPAILVASIGERMQAPLLPFLPATQNRRAPFGPLRRAVTPLALLAIAKPGLALVCRIRQHQASMTLLAPCELSALAEQRDQCPIEQIVKANTGLKSQQAKIVNAESSRVAVTAVCNLNHTTAYLMQGS